MVNMLITSTFQQTNCSRCNIEMRQFVLIDNIPVSRERGICRSTLKYESTQSKQQRPINNISMTCDPADVARSSNPVAGMCIEYVLSCCTSSKEITTGSVHYALRFTS